MRKLCGISVVAFLLMTVAVSVSAAENIFVAGKTDLKKSGIQITDIQCGWKLTNSGLNVVTKEGSYQWPGITLRGNWNLAQADKVTAVVKNTSKVPLKMAFRIDDKNSSKQNSWLTVSETIGPGRTAEMSLTLPKSVPAYVTEKVYGMRGLPGNIQADTNTGKAKGSRFDKKSIEAFWVFTSDNEDPTVSYSVKKIFCSGDPKAAQLYSWTGMSEKEFFPMIDKFGQFKHVDWPGKIHSDAELKDRRVSEAKELAASPAFTDRDQFGGWKNGPKQKKTGHFRTEKIDGKWWLVDPEGNLFWSHGVDCVRFDDATGISDREHLFEDLPAKDSEFGKFYGASRNAAHGFYANREFKTYSFFRANLFRKYGPDYQKEFTDTVHKRIQSWGLNTIANWSDSSIYRERKTPFTINAGTWSPKIEGSEGFWGKFPDPFHPDFRKSVEMGLDKQKEFLDDPWCLGIFVNNEIAWGSDTSLSAGTIQSPKTQPSKIAMLDWLKKKYKTIDKMNAIWKTSYADWDAFMESRELPQGEGKTEDLKEFYKVIADEYFRTIHDIIRAKAPNKLDLGCRFAWKNDNAVIVSSKYVDVISFNMYKTSVADFKLPEGAIDKPCIIGEFHFGALDRGMLHTGLVKRKDQQERADTYRSYVEGALENPNWVGTHWFQFCSQATTGRTDGENYQIGFVDFCDTPYVETIEAVRKVGQEMYQLRAKAK